MLGGGVLIILTLVGLASGREVQDVNDICFELANQAGPEELCAVRTEFEEEDYSCVEVGPVRCPQGKFVSAGSVCRHTPDDVIFLCQRGAWVTQDILDAFQREKRGVGECVGRGALIGTFIFPIVGTIIGGLFGLAAGLSGGCSGTKIEYVTNKPPVIDGCPSNVIEVTAPEGNNTAIATWPQLSANDPEGKKVTLDKIYGNDRNSIFPEGTSVVGYKARDPEGGADYCWIRIKVKVIKCQPEARYPKHGDVSCTHAVDNLYGSVCTFTCEKGYQIAGNGSAAKCQQDGTWNVTFPSCEPVSCGDPGTIQSGSLSCPDGHVFPRLCYVSCNHGYRQRQGFPFKRCTETGVWTPTQDCVDVEAPKFPQGCPSNMRLDSGPLESPVAVNWTDPDVTDNSGHDVTLTSDVSKGSMLDVGIHIIKLTATDLAGNSRSCSFVVIISARECQPPVTPSNGRMTCSRGYVEGSECSVTCNAGYRPHGNASITCLQSQQWSSQLPTCQALECPNVPRVDHGHYECGSQVYPAVCVLVCDSSYVRDGQSSIKCQQDGNWSAAYGTCTDKEPPSFPNGCSRNMEVYQSRLGQPTTVTWTPPDVTDNGGGNVTLLSSHVSGSEFTTGVTFVTYTATDGNGNTRKCEFTVTVTTLTCPPLSQNYSTTNFLRYRCPQKNVLGAECTPYCTQGFPLRGAERVTCEIQDNVTSPPLMAWTWASNTTRPECVATNCSKLTPPLNGALSCYQGNFAKECLMSCQEPWDVPSSTDGRYVCPNDLGTWRPPNVLNCTVRKFPGAVRMMSDLSYYTNTCNMSLSQLKQAFIQRINNSTFGGACRNTPSCRAENIEVTCGALTVRRRRDVEEGQRFRRQTGSHYVRITFEVVVEYNETGKQPEEAYQEVVNRKEAIYNGLKSEADQGRFNIGSLTADENSVGYPLLRADCPAGTLFVDKATKKKISCVGCGAGQYVAVNGSRCEECEVGSYTEMDNATSCTPCPPGWSTSSPASTSSSDCQETCKAGHYSEDGFVPCLPCPPGQYQSRDQATRCRPCPASTWTNGGASGLEQCLPADVILSNTSSLTAHVTGSLTSMTLAAFVHVSDLGIANVTFTFRGSTHTYLSVLLYVQSEVHATLPQNSSTSVTVQTTANSWSRLVLTFDPSSGQANVSHNDNTIITLTTTPISSLTAASVTVVASLGEVMVSGLFAEESLPGHGDLGAERSSCHGNSTLNLLTWSPAPRVVRSPSVCDAVDECQSSPCSSHSVCVNRQSGFLCQCQHGYNGPTCDIAPEACFEHQCQNSATCLPEGDSYTCLCTEDYSGEYCQLRKVHGGFSDWTAWGNCSDSCGGQQQRQRRCNNPTPQNGGDNCTGLYTETRRCGQADCPVSGQWGDWSQWSACSVTCGGGNRTRQRSCDNPPPRFGGDPCDEDSEDNEACNTVECPVNGGWRSWSEWTPCSVTCGGGTRSRVRSCDSPSPANGGDPCSGSTNETEACSEQNCPECSGLRRSVTTLLVCEEETSPYLKTCNLTCAPGYVTSKLLPQYRCGESTAYLWNDQKDQTSPVVLPVCTVAKTAENVNVVQYVPMKSGCDVDKEAVRAGVSKNIEQLPCVSAGCQTSVSVVCVGQSAGVQSRKRRSDGNLRVVTQLSMDLGKSTNVSANETDSVKEYVRRLLLADRSVVLLAKNETDKLFSVNVNGDVIEPDVTSVTYNTSLQCAPGSTMIYFVCVPCVPGSREVDGQCELCPVGQYQDEAGSTHCKTCPDGLAWDLPGAADVSQCIFSAEDRVSDEEQTPTASDNFAKNTMTIVVSTVVVLIVVVATIIGINAYVFCKKRPERDRSLGKMEPTVQDMCDVQSAQSSIFQHSHSSRKSSYQEEGPPPFNSQHHGLVKTDFV